MNIEDLIKERKEHLDTEPVPEGSWNIISKEWKKEKTSFSWWKVAAIAFLTISVGLLLHNQSLQTQVEELASLGDISEEYKAIEADYVSQINEIEATLEIQEAKSNTEYQWLFNELQTLDEVNTLYRKDIGSVDENVLVGTLIDHYEKKIRLLKKLELEIKRNNKRQQNETDNTNDIRI